MDPSNGISSLTTPAVLQKEVAAEPIDRSCLAEFFSETEQTVAPPCPQSLDEAGLSNSFVSDLLIKHLYRFGTLSGGQLAQKTCLSFPLIDNLLDDITENQYVEKRGGRGLGNSANRFSLTERGRNYGRDLLNLDTYIGPAPVPLAQYHKHLKSQNLREIPITSSLLRQAWSDFVIDGDVLEKIGPAIRSGTSCFLYGPPGTGKTTLARQIVRLFDAYGGFVAIPHAVFVGGSIIRVYDPVYHEKITDSEMKSNTVEWINEPKSDLRWVLCRRPAVVCGGELTLDMLDLRYNSTTRYYEAPFQLKANGGVLIIDDFGRQLVSPRDLLNRWIVPLEERVDYLTLHTGKKFSIPFDQFIIFSTNLDPLKLADEAFLRRIRYKIHISEPSRADFIRIFQRECEKKGIRYEHDDLASAIDELYINQKRPFRACDPRDITDLILDYCLFEDVPLEVSGSLLNKVFLEYHTDIQTGNVQLIEQRRDVQS